MATEAKELIPCVGGPLDGRTYGHERPVPPKIIFPVSRPEEMCARFVGENEPIGGFDKWGRFCTVPDGKGGWRMPEYDQAVYRLEETAEGPVYRFEGMRE